MTRSDRIPIPAPSAEVEIKVYQEADPLVTRCRRPRSALIKSPFHDLTAKAWVEFYREDMDTPLDFGNPVEIFIDGLLVFRGRIAHIRLDSVEAPLTFFAKRNPHHLFPYYVSGVYENLAPTAVLTNILDHLPEPRLHYSIAIPSPRRIERLGFVGEGLFQAIDLLAILDGNALWNISWDSALRYRPRDVDPDHRIRFDPDHMTLRLWQTDDDIRNAFVFHGGVLPPNGVEFQRGFSDQESIQRFGRRSGHLYARPVTTDTDYELFREAVLAEISQPATERAIEIAGFLPAMAGDVILLEDPPFPLSNDTRRQPIEMVEFDYRHDRVLTRLHFKAGSRMSGVEGDPVLVAVADTVASRMNPFQLDRSALDSPAYLDKPPS